MPADAPATLATVTARPTPWGAGGLDPRGLNPPPDAGLLVSVAILVAMAVLLAAWRGRNGGRRGRRGRPVQPRRQAGESMSGDLSREPMASVPTPVAKPSPDLYGVMLVPVAETATQALPRDNRPITGFGPPVPPADAATLGALRECVEMLDAGLLFACLASLRTAPAAPPPAGGGRCLVVVRSAAVADQAAADALAAAVGQLPPPHRPDRLLVVPDGAAWLADLVRSADEITVRDSRRHGYWMRASRAAMQ